MTDLLNGVWALVPVKDFQDSKQRLGAAIPEDMRCRLAEAMFRDVLDTLTTVPHLERIAVVTKDRRAIQIATEMDAFVIHESENQGETEAVVRGTVVFEELGVRTMLVVPGDIPFITKEDVEAVLQAGRVADIVLVPAHDERGTNAVLLTPPNILELRFGNDSFRPHFESAQALRVRVTVLNLPNIGLDIDNPTDLAAVAGWSDRRAGTRTHMLLEEAQRNN